MRRIAISLSGLVALAISLLTTAPAAFAMRVVPAGGGTSATAPRVVHQAGLGFWPLSLIVIGAVIVLSAAVGAAVIGRSRRSAPATALS